MLALTCPGCKTQLTIPDTLLGHNAKCPRCGTVLQILPATAFKAPAKTPRPRPAAVPRRPPPAPAATLPGWAHLVPLAVLVLVLVGLLGRDAFTDAPRQVQVAVRDEPVLEDKKGSPQLSVQIQDEPEEFVEGAQDPPVQVAVVDEPEVREPVKMPVQVEIKDEPEEGGGPAGSRSVDPTRRLILQYSRNGKFGLTVAQTGKQLTYSPNGATSNAVVMVDGRTGELGGSGAPERITELPAGPDGSPGVRSVWSVGKVEFAQTYELVPSKQPVVIGPGVPKRLVDTLLIRYTITNRDSRAHRAGLRTMVDTLIGNNDGVPFTVPGLPGLVDTCRDFPTPKSVPDFIQALEVPNLSNPGTVATMTLKLGGKLDPPSRVILTCWLNVFNFRWNEPVVPIAGDSAVVIYWKEKSIPAGKKRAFGFAYGLGSVEAGKTGRLGVTLGGSFDPGQVFTITAYATHPAAGQTLTLELPAGLERVEGAQTQPVRGGGGTAVVTWKAKVLNTGEFPLRVRSSTGAAVTKIISIARPSGGNFTLQLAGDFAPGKDFNVSARVTKPLPGQTLKLQLPYGLSRAGGDEVQTVPAVGADGQAVVTWKVRVDLAGKHPVRVQSSSGVTQTKMLVITPADQNLGRFTVALGGDIAPGKVFTVSARVPSPVPDQTLTLNLDPGLERVGGQQTAPAAGSPAWQVRVRSAGKHTIAVRSSTGITLKKALTIEEQAQGAGQFTLAFTGEFAPGKDFVVTAQVKQPAPGQRLTLTLPEGLRLEEGAQTQQVPAAVGGVSTVTWRLRVLALGRLPVRVASTTGIARTKVLTLKGTEGPGQIFGGR
jgi:hypothetical protein